MVIDTVSLFAETLHRSGAPAHVLEERVGSLMAAAGLRGSVVAAPTAVWLEVDGRARVLRLEPSEPDLERLSDLYAWHGVHGTTRLGPKAHRALRAIGLRAPRWPWPAQAGAFAVSGASAGALMGQTWTDSAVASLGGLAVWACLSALSAPRFRALSMLGVGLVGGLVGAIGGLFGSVPSAAALASIVIVLPGLGLTVALSEVASGHWSSGGARLLGATASAGQLAAGLALASGLASALQVEPVAAAGAPVSSLWVPWLAPAAFAVLLRAHPGHIPMITAVAALGFFVASTVEGPLGAALAAFVVAVSGNTLARVRGIPGLVTIVPGILLLVPGSVGVRGVAAMLARESQQGVEIALQALIAGGALALGLLVAHAVWPPPVHVKSRSSTKDASARRRRLHTSRRGN